MTWPALLLLLTTPTQMPNAPTPVVTMVQGNVIADVEGQSTIVKRQLNIPAGSTVATDKQSAAAIYWQPGLVVYLGAETQICLSGSSGLPDIQLLRGNIRTVSRSAAIVQTAGTATQIGRGIVRHSVDGSISRVACESGIVRTLAIDSKSRPTTNSVVANDSGQVRQVSASSSSSSLEIAPGEQLVHDASDGSLQEFPPFESGSLGLAGRLNVQQLQLETVAQASRAQRGETVPPVPPLPEDNGKKEEDEEDRKRGEKNIPKPPTDDDATRGLDNLLPPELDDIPEPDADQDSTGTNTQLALGTSGINLALGNVSLSTAAGGAGGLFTDANQATNAGMLTAAGAGLPAGANFPGNIHPVTSETVHSLNDVSVVFSDGFPLFRQFWSIGIGTPPTGQINTGVNTGTSTTPDAVAIPQFDAYIVRLDQYGLTDPASDAAATDTSVSISGLVGANPQNPNIQGATPLVDERAEINDRLTFALGELAVDLDGTTPQLVVRRSDQDRMIVKDPGGNDANDQVTVNTQVTEFIDKADPLFFPSNPTVKVPGRGSDLLTNRPSYSTLDPLRKAAATTLMADQLFEYARRTGQTRFVVDGKILDISGYQGR
jgi:hypothetical protein